MARPISKATPKTVHTTQASKTSLMKKQILDIVRDVQEPKKRKGISYTAIKNELSHRHGIDTKVQHLQEFKEALAQAVFQKELVKVGGKGVARSFRVDVL